MEFFTRSPFMENLIVDLSLRKEIEQKSNLLEWKYLPHRLVSSQQWSTNFLTKRDKASWEEQKYR